MDKTLQCELCPKRCRIPEGARGDCRIRVHLDGRLQAVTYGYPCSVHVDPIEKKPLYHFLPGSGILSLATAGCNLHCRNCQNWEISQRNPEDLDAVHLPPDALVDLAKACRCPSVAYTYTDPVVYYEYAYDCAVRARDAGMRNVLVTAAYVLEAPWRELCRVTDAANIDLKSMDPAFYRDNCDAELEPVLRALDVAREEGVHLEVTHLVIPTLNDRDEAFRGLCRWVREHLGAETPLHFSRFYPQYRLQHLPPTPAGTLRRARAIAAAEGLAHVYLGNLPGEDGEDTVCAGCGAVLVRRRGFTVTENRIRNGRCAACGRPVQGVWQ